MSLLMLNDFAVPGYGMNVAVSATLKDQDASGDTSSTARAKKGNKGKKMEVRCRIRFTEADSLRELIQMAEATENGDGVLYTITNDTANAAGMRKGRFSGTVRAEESDTVHAWDVSFSLAEQISVPELAEAREETKTSTAQTNEGEVIGAGASTEEEEPLGFMAQNLKKLDNWLGERFGQ